MILGAGLGTRLRPLTDECPKPLVPVGDGPAIGDVLARVRASLTTAPVVVNTHHRPEELQRFCEAAGVGVSHEPELLGTAGGVNAAASKLGDGDVLVWNGDILAPLDAGALVRAHERAGAVATLVVRRQPAGKGNVGLDQAGRVVRLRAQAFGEEHHGGLFLGIHVVGDALRARLPRTGCLVGDVYLPALAAGTSLAAFVTDVPFVDVGTLQAYLEANRAWLDERLLASWSHPTAEVRAPLDASVVGAGAVVRAPLVRCVVWPGARVDVPLADAVVTPRATVAVPRG